MVAFWALIALAGPWLVTWHFFFGHSFLYSTAGIL